MAVDRDVAVGTPVITSEGKSGTVIRAYPGTSVVTVRVQGAVMSMMRHELHYAATEVDGFHQMRGGK